MPWAYAQCEFIAWLQTTFLTDPAFSSITAYFYNQAMGTLTRGGVLTASGNA